MNLSFSELSSASAFDVPTWLGHRRLQRQHLMAGHGDRAFQQPPVFRNPGAATEHWARDLRRGTQPSLTLVS